MTPETESAHEKARLRGDVIRAAKAWTDEPGALEADELRRAVQALRVWEQGILASKAGR